MNSRERLYSILQGKTPDRIPWFGDLDYWMHAQISKGILPARYQGDGMFQLHRDLGVGFYLQGFFPFSEISENTEVIEFENEQTRTKRVITPHGEIYETWTYMSDSYSWAPTKHMFSEENLAAFRYWIENTNYRPNYELIRHRRNLIEDIGVMLCYVPKSPLMQMIALMAGVENTIFFEAEEPEAFADLMSLMFAKHSEAAQLVVESEAEFVMIPENLSSEVVGKRLFDMYMRPYEEKWVKAIHDNHKVSLIHLDGTLKGLIREVSATGVRIIEALTPAPVGDISIEDMHAWVNKDTIIWGGIPGIYFTEMVTDDDFDAHVIRMLRTMCHEPRYVLGVADQVPPDGLWRRIERVSELVEIHGHY